MFLWAARPRGSRLPTICLNSLRMAEAVITNRVRRTPLLGRRFAQRYRASVCAAIIEVNFHWEP
jgi:hypothetical protein